MKKQTRYVILLIVLAIFALIMYLVLGKDNLSKGKNSTTIIVGDYTIWDYSNNSWLNITKKDTIAKMSWLDYDVYISNKKIGNYYLWHNDKWYIFDSNKNSISREGPLLAFRSNHEIKVKNFTTRDITDYRYVEKVLQDNNISSKNYTVATETPLDIDSDGVNETFYFISNAFSLESNPNITFSIVFMVKNDQITTIYKDISNNNYTNGCRPYLTAVFDIDNDEIYEMVISCGRYSIQKPVDMLYKLTDKGFKIVISNQ